jgi:integrase
MAQGIRRRKSTDGKRASYQVMWRDGGGRLGEPRSVTVTREQEAKRLFAAIVANGNRLPAEYAHLARRRGANATEVVTSPVAVTADAPATEVPAQTFAAFAAEHVTNLTGVGAGYRAQCHRDLHRHLVPAFGALSLAEVDERAARAWLRGLEAGTHPWLRDKPLAHATRRRLVVQAGAIMRAAQRAGLVPVNPFDGLRVGRPRHTEGRRAVQVALTHDEWRRLQAELPAGLGRDLATVLASTGLRFGEATALEVRHVRLDGARPSLTVTQAWKADGRNGYYLDAPKSERSIREVPIGATVAEVLAPHLAGKRDDELVFTTERGAPVRTNNYSARVWRPAVARFVAAGGRRVRIHDLRHTHASWLIASGLPLTAIQRRLGHESIQLTSDTYGHLLPETETAAVEAIERALADSAA